MKHIKLFEDYSDEELRDLQDTLHDIGHKSKWTFGEDFGFGHGPNGVGFKTEITGKEYPAMSSDLFDVLFYKGDIVPYGQAFAFKSPKDFGIPDNWRFGIDGDSKFSAARYAIHIDPKDYMRFVEDSERAKIFGDVIQKLGEIRK
jgi:hypothetical protein